MNTTQLATTLLASALSLPAAPGNEVHWEHGKLEQSLANAKKLKQQVLAYFWANPSEQCSKLFGTTMKDKECVARMKRFVCFSANTTLKEGNTLAKKYNVKSLPTVLILNSDGGIEDAIIGFCPVKNFKEELDRIGRGDRTVSFYRDRANAAPDDLSLRYDLAVQLNFVGYTEQYKAICEGIRKSDPTGESLTGATFIFNDLKNGIRKRSASIAEADLSPLIAFLKKTKHQSIRWEGWTWIGGIEHARESREAALDSFREGWKHCPETRVLDFSGQLITSYWVIREDLRTAEKKFLIMVGESGVEAAKAMKATENGDPTKQAYVGANYEAFLANRYDLLGCAYAMGGRRKLAIQALEKAIALDPKNKKWKARLEMIQGPR